MSKSLRLFAAFGLAVAMLMAGIAMAADGDSDPTGDGSHEDGQMMRRNVSKTPDLETGDALMSMMKFYVPAQTSAGTLLVLADGTGGIEYYDASGVLTDTRGWAKPLLINYLDGIDLDDHEDGEMAAAGGAAFGTRDAFIALSLDDGESWKRSNLSDHAALSSFTLANGHEYSGDAVDMVHASAGNRVMAAWISKYCSGGDPAYTLSDEDRAEDQSFLTETFELPLEYVIDLFGVAGSQKSVDYTLQGHPEVGEVPYGCVWTARGELLTTTLETGEQGYDILWTKPERLTSGRRDPNRLEIAAAEDAGFVIVWQEDPLGLRPGTGLGPGEGWSGAIVNAKTDIWYSRVGWEHFDQVWEDDGELPPDTAYTELVTTTLAAYAVDFPAGEFPPPKVAAPMAVPVRVTDNNICRPQDGNTDADPAEPYCWIDFSQELPDELPVERYDESPLYASTFCSDTIEVENEAGITKPACVTSDQRVLMGRVGASRPRIALHGYDSDEDGVSDSAWVVLGYEETKALGAGAPDEVPNEGEGEDEVVDEGKNLWYHSFDMADPDIVSHGNILNQPAYDPLSYDPDEDAYAMYPITNTFDIGLNLFDYNYSFYETEIARRFSLISQDADKAGPSDTVAFPLIKQGNEKQGGAADIFARRIVLPDGFNPAADNPYEYENMACDSWDYVQSSDARYTDAVEHAEYNPYYPKGICLSTPANLSGTTIAVCSDKSLNDGAEIIGEEACAALMWDDSDETYPTVTEWRQCDGEATWDATTVDGQTDVCTEDDIDLADQSWANPYDVAKGHRGFMDGDFIMVLYAWAPNHKLNAVGHDHYNLYVRRSFDGGQTWTTTPADLADLCYDDDGYVVDCDGIVVTENYGIGGTSSYSVTFTYAVGVFEQARNVSQLIGNRDTILDPRYSPTPGNITRCMVDGVLGGCPDDVLYDGTFTDKEERTDDIRDPSKFFIVYETGDNTTVATGEATPLDLFYSRAYSWGDYYDLAEYVNTSTGETTLSFDWLEHGDPESGEAAITGNPGGTFFYGAWNQALEIGDEEFTDMDAYFRRVMYIDGTTEDSDGASPTALIAFQSDTAVAFDEEITFVGTARDRDHIGKAPHEAITEYEWTSDVQGFLSDQKSWSRQAGQSPGQLWRGFHTISFRAKDDEGNWSLYSQTTVLVAEQIFTTFLPTVLR